MASRCPPYLEVGDVVMVRNSSDMSFSMAVVRTVSTPTFTTDFQVEEKNKRKAITTRLLCEYGVLGYVGSLWAVCGTLKRYKASRITSTRSWHSIERILDDAQVTHHHNGEPTEWIWQDIRNAHG